MATEAEFVTAPSTPEPAEPAAAAQQDILEFTVEQKLIRHRDGGEGGSSSSMTIFRVPAHVRAGTNKELYEPRLVSIGPYYRGRHELRAMEQHKWRYLDELLAKCPGASLAGCVRAVRDVERRARRCYSEQTEIFAATAGDFAEMLLLDGCFVLQFFMKWYWMEPDRLCDVGWGLPLLLSDLLLLENQIPFFVLEALFRAVNHKATRLGLLRLIVPKIKPDGSALCKELLAGDGVVPGRADEIHIHHLLHLLYETSVPTATAAAELQSLQTSASVPGSPASPPPPLPQEDEAAQLPPTCLRVKKAVGRRFAFLRDLPRVSSSMNLLRKASACLNKLLALKTRTGSPPPMVVPSVTLLREAGVRFEKKAPARDMFDVTFDAARGVLRMPPMKFDYATKTHLVNLVAFEQTIGDDAGGKPVSSYAALVGSLVRAGGDVEHLQKHGVTENLLGSDDDAVAQFYQKLGDCSTLDYGERHHLAALFRDLDEYYRSSWRRHKTKFLRDYCSNPWAMLALVFAGCAFCFALFKFSTAIYGLAHPYCRHC
jgi:hypothetical protein